MQRFLWFVLGAGIALAALWLLPTRERLEEAPPQAVEPERLAPTPGPEAPLPVLRPSDREAMIGPWLGENGTYRLSLEPDGTYDWSGNPKAPPPQPKAATPASAGPWRSPFHIPTLKELVGLDDRRPWDEPGHGAWTWRDGTLRLSALGGIYFTWDTDEHTLYGGFLGVAGGHTPGVTLFRVQHR